MHTITDDSIADIAYQLEWKSDQGRHVEMLHAANVNIWRDWLPRQMVSELKGTGSGDRVRIDFSPGEAIENAVSTNRFKIERKRFDGIGEGPERREPRSGRFYPKGLLKGVANVFRVNRTPFRCVNVKNGTLDVDLNHPLSGKAFSVSATVGAVKTKKVEKGGTSMDWIGMLAEGPGMQARANGTATDFFSDDPFSREDERPDTVFYEKPRFVQHLDDAAIDMVRSLYGAELKDGMRVLDLMSSWTSHLPENLQLSKLTVLGMNEAELKRNERATDRLVQDLNASPAMALEDDGYDAALCTVSVEYLTRPVDVFREVGRVLRPGGVFMVAFSDRWFPPKAIRIWKELHEFERMGLVLEYFDKSGAFTDLSTFSVRGLPRPAHDKYAAQRATSDPVFLVKCRKRA